MEEFRKKYITSFVNTPQIYYNQLNQNSSFSSLAESIPNISTDKKEKLNFLFAYKFKYSQF